ncbi:MAG TPA: adenylate/guanylate cyclase domain-containing protein [Methylomirabilota bacterium]|jgi:TolB-like protein/class 3 adenylate cyclase
MGAGSPLNRRLAAILAADIAGYSRLMHEDEAATVRDLKAHQTSVLPLIARHGGRVIDTAGDGILAEFPSVIGATECAVEIQRVMDARNENVPEHRRMRFRIGINLGDVVHDDTRIYGDGINIAARLEALADPGGVLVSRTVYEHVHGKLPVAFEDTGERHLKNIEEPVRVYRIHAPGTAAAPPTPTRRTATTARRRRIVFGAVLPLVVIAVAAAWWANSRFSPGRRATGTEAPRLSIVVLPFTNLSGEPNQDYFADGITEELTSDLSRLAGSFVISRNTAFTFKGKAVDARQVGRELGVRYVLEGNVRRTGRSVRVNAQLVDAGTGAHLWAEQIDVDQGTLATSPDTFGIAPRLARALSVELVNVEGRRAPRANPDAVDLVMRGWSLLNAGPNREDVQTAVTLFEAALRIDSDNAQANVGLAQALIHVLRSRWDPARARVLARADEAATRATAVAPDAGDRNLTTAHVGRARHLIVVGRAADAVASMERAIRLSPRDPDLYLWYYVVCHAHTHLARDAATIEWCLKSIGTGKMFWHVWVDLASAYAWRGQTAEAAAAVSEILKLRPGLTVQQMVEEAWAHSDNATFRQEYQRIAEGVRKAGLPER